MVAILITEVIDKDFADVKFPPPTKFEALSAAAEAP